MTRKPNRPDKPWLRAQKPLEGGRTLIGVLGGFIVVAVLMVVMWIWLPILMIHWTDRLALQAVRHINAMRHVESHSNAASAYWVAAADLASYVSAAVTFVGVIFTLIVVIYGVFQARVAVRAMRSSSRQQQMRLLFDLDLALLNNPEILAMMEGQFDLDTVTILRSKSNAFAHAFLNACDTIFDYYEYLDRDTRLTHWPAWRQQLCYYLEHRPELRSMARQAIERGFYTDRFRDELNALVIAAERSPTAEQAMPQIVVAEPDDLPSQPEPFLRELSESEADVKVLRGLYESVYVQEFPDPNERESLQNMEKYLTKKKPSGWYGKNNYHIVVAELDGQHVGLCVSDYLSKANVGVIEFLVVMPQERGRKIGRRLIDFTENLIVADSRRSNGSDPRGMLAEMNDPFRIDLRQDNFDPFDRAEIWHKWGFKYLHFRYVQPPLADGKAPAEHLILLCKPRAAPFDSWSSTAVQEALRDYLIWAMRIPDPEGNPQFQAMKWQLEKMKHVNLLALTAYIGRGLAVRWYEVRDRRDPFFNNAMKLYSSFFKPSEDTADDEDNIAISDEDFAFFLDQRGRTDLRYSYHLWVARGPVGEEVIGLASFFTFGHCGFGGYTCRKLIRGIKPVSTSVAIASVEERMRRDNPTIDGWFIECSPHGRKKPANLFYRHGFREVDLKYRQPRLPGTTYDFQKAPVLQLLYKPFGRRLDQPRLSTPDFLAAMADIFHIVYDVRHPTSSPYHEHLRDQLFGKDQVPFRIKATRSG